MLDQVIEKCKKLSLSSLAENMEKGLDASKEKNWSFLHTLDYLLDHELERRKQNRISLRFKQSKLYDKNTIDQFNFNFHGSRKKNKNRILSLMSMEFIKDKKDIVLIGNPGTGKSLLAKIIGYEATINQAKVLFTTAMDMINHLIAAEADKSLLKKLNYYQSPELLVIDELGFLSLGVQGSNLFFQVISARHDKKSSLITTNLPFAAWGKIFESTTVATAIADRLVFNSEIIIMEGDSYRKSINNKKSQK